MTVEQLKKLQNQLLQSGDDQIILKDVCSYSIITLEEINQMLKFLEEGCKKQTETVQTATIII